MPETTKTIDHKAEALQWLRAAEREAADLNLPDCGAFAAVALVHSNLAIAEGQERVAKELRLTREGGPNWQAERQAILDAINLFGDTTLHDALTDAGLLMNERRAEDHA